MNKMNKSTHIKQISTGRSIVLNGEWSLKSVKNFMKRVVSMRGECAVSILTGGWGNATIKHLGKI